MSKIKSFEVKEPLLKTIEDYIEKNGYTFSEFIRMCVHSFFFRINQSEKSIQKINGKPKKPVRKPSSYSRRSSSYKFNTS